VIWYLQDARREVKDVAMGGGLCIDDPRLDDEINAASNELILGKSWKLTVFPITFYTSGGVLRLPWNMETVLTVRINGRAAYPWSQYYEYNPAGPGMCPLTCSWSRDLVDLAQRQPLQYPLSEPSRIMVTTDAEEADGTVVILRGTNTSNLEIFTDGQPGETITLKKGQPFYTRNIYKNVTAVVKGFTNGFVRLQTYDPDEPTAQGKLLATFHPSEENPQYRLYKVKGSRGGIERIDTMTKVAFHRIRHASDFVLVQNMPALKLMVQALHQRRNEDFDAADKLIEDATKLMRRQLADYQPRTPEVHKQVGAGMAIGRVQ
jgi:hypothetical protein